MRSRKLVITVLMVLFGLTTTAAQSQTKTEKAGSNRAAVEMQNAVRTFYELREKTLDERGSEKDVTQLMDLLSDQASYEHPRANVKMTKEQARAGILAHLNEGKKARITLDKMMTGADFVVIETTLQYELPAKNGGFEQVMRKGAAIFEFAKGKIQRVAEY